MYAYAVERLKSALGSGFETGKTDVIGMAESQLRAMKDIKAVLDLPPDAAADQILAAIQNLKEGSKGEKEGWWCALWKKK